MGFSRFISAQVFYTIASRDIERELVPLCLEEGLGILPWSPLAGGLLSGKYPAEGSGPEGARRSSFDFPIVDKPRAFACVEAMRPMAAAQLIDNLAAANITLSAEEINILDTISALPPEYPGWMVSFQNARDINGNGSQRS